MLRADRVVAVSSFAADSARRNVLDIPVRVIHNGVDLEKFRPSPQRYLHRPCRLLYVGKWAPLKGVDLLAPIMRILGGDFELHYTGGGASRANRFELPENMHNLGRLYGDDAVVAAMQDADVLLFPTRSEGFGLVAAEAMACGLPVVGTCGSSLEEVVADGVTGILCDRDDAVAFAQALRLIASDRDKRMSMSRAARRRAVAAFDQNVMVETYVKLYEECFTCNDM